MALASRAKSASLPADLVTNRVATIGGFGDEMAQTMRLIESVELF
jgi:hypothetical protein